MVIFRIHTHIHKCSALSTVLLNLRLSTDFITLKQNYTVFPDVSSLWDKCHTEEATLLHSYVLCFKLTPFWTNTLGMLHTATETDLLLVVLEVSDQFSLLSKFSQQLLSYTLIVANKCSGKRQKSHLSNYGWKK